MADKLHAIDFLAARQRQGKRKDDSPASVCVVFGNEPFLKRLVRNELRRRILGDQAADTPATVLGGGDYQWRDVIDELSTASLFGGGPRLVEIEDADDFVSRFRAELETYVERPRTTGVLVLEVSSWPANTKLYKKVAKTGCAIECRPPEKAVGRNKELDEQRLCQWLVDWARQRHEITLARGAAEQLLELVGPQLGLLDQELAKLALFVGDGEKVTPNLVLDIAGGWRTKTTWDLLDAATGGDAAEALKQLDRLLQAGEPPQALFGAISWSLRRFNAATRLIQEQERREGHYDLRAALTGAGFRDWPAGTMKKAEAQLRQLGRERAGSLYGWLLETDLALKGTHSAPARARLTLEKLIVKLSKQAASPKVSQTPA